MNTEETVQERSVPVPPYRIHVLKENWLGIYSAVVEYGRLQIRFNRRARLVDLRTCPETPDHSALERAACFVKAVVDGFRLEDAVAIIKYRDIFTEEFDLGNIRKLRSSHMSRAIGRVIGREGKTKQSIENFARCKFVLVNQKVTVMGSSESIKIAKDAIGRLVQGSEPGSIFNRLRLISSKLKDRYGSIQTVYEDMRLE